MPVDATQTVNIVCDNPDCPGNSLDPADRMGWTFVTTEVYGQPTTQHVFCCADCAGTVTSILNAQQAEVEAREEATVDA